MTARFGGRLGVQQRVLPEYRVPFFDLLTGSCDGGLSVFAGLPRTREGIVPGTPRAAHFAQARNVHLLNGSLYLCYQRGLTAWLDEWNPDALIVEANPRYLATPAAVRWMHERGRQVIGWGLGAPSLSGTLGGLRSRRRSTFLRQFDGLIAYSQRGAREYEAAGIPPDRIFVAANAVAGRPTGMPVRRPSTDPPTVLFVGRLQRRKQLDSLLRACAEVAGQRPGLVIVGDGPDRARLETVAARIYPEARFVGAKHGPELEPIFAGADLFVLPGTGGLAVQAAMAHGLPIIVARGDGTQDDLVREGNGWQIAPGDHSALAHALGEALSDPARLRRMGEEFFRIVSEEINLEAMVDAFVKALNSTTRRASMLEP